MIDVPSVTQRLSASEAHLQSELSGNRVLSRYKTYAIRSASIWSPMTQHCTILNKHWKCPVQWMLCSISHPAALVYHLNPSPTAHLCDLTSSYSPLCVQITEAVSTLVASLQGDSQGSATQALLEPILAPLQAQLQQPHQNGAGPSQQPPERVEYVGALVDRLNTVFK